MITRLFRKHMRGLLFAMVLIAGGMWVDTALAQTSGDAINAGDGALSGLAQILSLVINVLTFISLLMLDFGGKLMGAELLTSEEVMNAIRPLWVFFRNITNVIFVLVLVFLAMANLLSSITGQSDWTIKEKLPKIIISLIAINFSLLGIRVAVDAVNVGTTAVLSLAATGLESQDIQSVKDLMEKKFDDEGKACGNGGEVGQCKAFYERVNATFCSEEDKNTDSCFFELNKNSWAEKEPNSTSRNLFLSFGIFFQKIQQLPLLARNLNQWKELVQNVLFSSILSLAYIFALAAVFIALVARMVVMWLFMAFSPLIVAGYIMGIGASNDAVTKFISTLIMPIKIAAAFSVSFVMVMAMSTYAPMLLEPGGSFFTLGPVLTQFGEGAASILWQVATVIIFWVAVKWALKGNEAESITTGIMTGAERMGNYVAHATVVDQPFLPVPGMGAKVGIGSLMSLPSLMMGAQNQERGRQKEILEARLSRNPGATISEESLLSVRNAARRTDGLTGKQDFLRELEKLNANELSNRRVLEEMVDAQFLDAADKEKFRGGTENEKIEILTKIFESPEWKDAADKTFGKASSQTQAKILMDKAKANNDNQSNTNNTQNTKITLENEETIDMDVTKITEDTTNQIQNLVQSNQSTEDKKAALQGILHNVGIDTEELKKIETEDDLEKVLNSMTVVMNPETVKDIKDDLRTVLAGIAGLKIKENKTPTKKENTEESSDKNNTDEGITPSEAPQQKERKEETSPVEEPNESGNENNSPESEDEEEQKE